MQPLNKGLSTALPPHGQLHILCCELTSIVDGEFGHGRRLVATELVSIRTTLDPGAKAAPVHVLWLTRARAGSSCQKSHSQENGYKELRGPPV